jgi:hypothetical protein
MFWIVWARPAALPASLVTFSRQKSDEFVEEKNFWMRDFFFSSVEEMRRNCIRKKLMGERFFSSGEEMGRLCTCRRNKTYG